MPISVSVVMPAHIEFKYLEGSVEFVENNLSNHLNVLDWEIIIVTSKTETGTDDGTPALADKIAQRNKKVRVIHNNCYVSLGQKYWQGLRFAKFDYFMMVPGKNTFRGDSLKNILDAAGKKDLVIGYHFSMKHRQRHRRIYTIIKTALMNLAFGLNLKYFSGTTLIPVKILQAIESEVRGKDSVYMAEILTILIRKYGLSYVEVPFFTRGKRTYGKTNVFKLSNQIGQFKTCLKLIRIIYCQKQKHNLKNR